MKPDGAPDLLMPLDITDAWIDMHMAGEGARSAWGGGGVGRPEVPEGGQPKPKVAAARAMASARMNPSVLIKVTCQSGIMIVLDKPRKKDVKRSDTTGSPQPRFNPA